MKTKILITLLFLSLSLSAQYTFEELQINSNGSSLPHSFVEFKGALYFSAINDNSGRELWKTDGTPEGTILVKDINPNGDADPRRFTVVNNTLFFTAKNGTNGRELWKTDGTTSGTTLVKDINTGFGDGVASAFIPFKVLNNKLIFTAQQQGVSNSYLFESDGSDAGTKPISTEVQVNVNVFTERNMVVYNNLVLFPGKNKNGSSLGTELYKTDLSTTVLVKDINLGSNSSFPAEMIVYNTFVYFVAEKSGEGDELWKTDGTASGTTLVKDIKPGSIGSFSNYARFKVFKDKLYFAANDGVHGREIWVSDGTTSGTILFIDINANGNQNGIVEVDGSQQLFYEFNDKMYFKATNTYNASNIENNIEPWETDGTIAGTKQLADLNPNGNSMSVYNHFFSYNNRLLFTGIDFNDVTKGTLWSYDFSTSPINIMPENTVFTDVEVDFYKPIIFNEALYLAAKFNINENNNGTELWKITSNPLSVLDTQEELGFHLYPNPTATNFTVSLKKNTIQSLKIYSLLGKQIVNRSVSNQRKIEVNISTLPKGIYFVKVKTDAKSITQKLIIK